MYYLLLKNDIVQLAFYCISKLHIMYRKLENEAACEVVALFAHTFVESPISHLD